MFPMRDVESWEGHEPRAIAFERHESGILRDKSFDSTGENMDAQPIGSKLFSGEYSASVVQVINPAMNTNGAVLRTASFLGTQYSILATGTTPVTGATDKTKPVVLASVAATYNALQFPVTLPAGYGLWIATNSGSSSLFLTYDLLP